MTALVDIVIGEEDDVLEVPNAALRFHSPENRHGGRGGSGAALEGEAPDAEATIWLLGRDMKLRSVQARLGLSNAMTTAVAGGPLREGQKVVIGTAAAPGNQGPFGLRLGF
jgi:HlyD family secretion protein